jgi:translocation and assembly module TamB
VIRARKWLLGVVAAILVIVVVLVALLSWVLYTPSGLRFALDRGVALMHGQIAYASASGTLAGTTTIDGLRYHPDDGTQVTIDHASVDLRPWALLGHTLHIARARIDGITLDLAPSGPSNEPSSFSLKPPLAIVLDDTRLTRIAVRSGGKPVFAANSLVVAGKWSSRQLLIRQLALRAADSSADLDGTIAIAPGYPGQGRAKFDWTYDGTRYSGMLASQSDGKTAQLHAALSAPVVLRAEANLKLDASHAWTLALNVPSFDTKALPALPASLKALALDVHGSGDGSRGKLAGNIVVNGTTLQLDPAQFRYDGKTVTLDPLRLHSPQIAGTATTTGVVHLDAKPMSFALDATWQDVVLPADLAGQVLATHGDVKLSGTTEQFAAKGALALGPPGRLSNMNVDLTGTPQQIDLHALKVVQKQGGLDMSGTIGLQKPISWKLDAVAKRFDPGAILAGWNGALDFKLASDGKLTPQGPVATLKLDKVAGTLRQRSITGSKADLTITPGNLLQGSLLLVAGNSRIHAVGKRGPATDAGVTLDVASLGDWLPNASGKLQGQFTLKGRWPKLAVVGHLQGSGLHDGDRSIDRLQLTASIPNIAQPGGDLDLALGGVHASGLDFDSVHLQGAGNAAAHHLQLRAQGKQVSATLALKGSWQANAKRWTGTLGGIELSPQGMPAWHQEQPSTITWQKGTLAVSQLCLSAGEPRLCASANRNTQGVTTEK